MLKSKKQTEASPVQGGARQDAQTGMGRRDGGDGRKRWALSRRGSAVLTIVTVIATTVALFFGGRYILNVKFLDSYAEGSYNAAIPNTLTYLNFPEPYLPYHNFGCAAFMMGNYDYAAGAFLEALDHNPPHDDPYPSKECQIRINLALALTRPLDIDGWRTEDERQALIRILTQAREYLTEDGCANSSKDVFDGHSEDAEQLKKDIDAALEKLSDPNGGGGGGDNQDNQDNQDEQKQQDGDDNGQGGQDRQSEDRLKERLNERKSEAMQDRAEEQQQWESLNNLGDPSSGSGGGGQGGGGPTGKTW